MERLFTLSGFTVLPFWALMMVVPGWKFCRRAMQGPLVVVPAALLYAVLVIPRLGRLLPQLVRPELHAIAALLGDTDGATIAWVHFLAFDLFVGRWIFLDAAERRLPAWIVSPLLFLTLMLGPLGLAAYLGVRAAPVRSVDQRVRDFVRAARVGSPLLLGVSLGAGVLLLASLGLQAFDPRQVTGASTWAKPAKFGASVFLTGVTLAWMVGRMTPLSRGLRRATGVLSVTFVIELVAIVVQAARGVPSHFNFTSPLNAAIFNAMGVAITIFWLTQAWITFKAFRYRFVDSTLGWGIRLGLLLSTLGAGLGFVMPTRPTLEQREALIAGKPTMVGGHAVSAAEDGPGLPVSHWSTVGGDLRVPHFLGLHALQLLPLLAWFLSRRRIVGDETGETSNRLIKVVGAGMGGMVLTTLVQALRARPLFAPDAATTVLALSVVSLTGLGVLVTLFPVWGYERSDRGRTTPTRAEPRAASGG